MSTRRQRKMSTLEKHRKTSRVAIKFKVRAFAKSSQKIKKKQIEGRAYVNERPWQGRPSLSKLGKTTSKNRLQTTFFVSFRHFPQGDPKTHPRSSKRAAGSTKRARSSSKTAQRRQQGAPRKPQGRPKRPQTPFRADTCTWPRGVFEQWPQ